MKTINFVAVHNQLILNLLEIAVMLFVCPMSNDLYPIDSTFHISNQLAMIIH